MTSRLPRKRFPMRVMPRLLQNIYSRTTEEISYSTGEEVFRTNPTVNLVPTSAIKQPSHQGIKEFVSHRCGDWRAILGQILRRELANSYFHQLLQWFKQIVWRTR